MIRYEPVINRGKNEPSNHISCKNSVCILIINSKFCISPLFDDSGRHQFFD